MTRARGTCILFLLGLAFLLSPEDRTQAQTNDDLRQRANQAMQARDYAAARQALLRLVEREPSADNYNHLASFSDYGNWIALAAPGTAILSTVNGGGYGTWWGTSFSSPIAAGVAALVLAVNPSLQNSAVVSLLEQTADNIGPANYFGAGLVNAYQAVMAAQPSKTEPTRQRRPPAGLRSRR